MTNWLIAAVFAVLLAVIAWLIVTDKLESDHLLVNPGTKQCYLQTPEDPSLEVTSCEPHGGGYRVILESCPVLDFNPVRSGSKQFYLCEDCSGSSTDYSCALNKYGKDVRWQVKSDI